MGCNCKKTVRTSPTPTRPTPPSKPSSTRQTIGGGRRIVRREIK